jgi:dTDP-4-dehydrorhamnose reductase
MKALIIGCNGLLGQNLIRALPDESWQIVGAGLDPKPILSQSLSGYRSLDVTQRPELESAIAHFSPDLILNAAAITDVDLCEREKDRCSLLNRDAVGWMAATGIPMAHISSDYVFDGEAGPYSESDATHPLSHYGSTKLESETLALSGSPRSLVLRTMTLWGKGHGGKTSFVDFVKNSLAAGKTIRIVTDQFGNPTLAEDLATAVWKLAAAGMEQPVPMGRGHRRPLWSGCRSHPTLPDRGPETGRPEAPEVRPQDRQTGPGHRIPPPKSGRTARAGG